MADLAEEKREGSNLIQQLVNRRLAPPYIITLVYQLLQRN